MSYLFSLADFYPGEYTSTNVIGADLSITTTMDPLTTKCFDVWLPDDMTARKRQFLSGVSVTVKPRSDGQGHTIVDINGTQCDALTFQSAGYDAATKSIGYNRSVDTTKTSGSISNPPLQPATTKFLVKCPANSVIAQVGASPLGDVTPLSAISFMCQDVNAKAYGTQYVKPIITNQAGETMPPDFVIGQTGVPILQTSRCEDGEVVAGIQKSVKSGYLNSVGFQCVKLKYPMPPIQAPPAPVVPVAPVPAPAPVPQAVVQPPPPSMQQPPAPVVAVAPPAEIPVAVPAVDTTDISAGATPEAAKPMALETIIGIAVGGGLALILIIVLVVYLYKRRSAAVPAVVVAK